MIRRLGLDPALCSSPDELLGQDPAYDNSPSLRSTQRDERLTDCISFVVMSTNGLTDALTSDHHFRQAGFRALLLEEP